MLLGCFREGDPGDPDIFVAVSAAVLEMFSPDAIMEATHPVTGPAQNTQLANCYANGSDLSDPDRTTNTIGQRRPCPQPSASKIMRHHPPEVFP